MGIALGKLVLGIVIGMLMALSTSAVVSTVLTPLLGLAGGGSLVLQARAGASATNPVGWQLFLLAAGLILGLLVGFELVERGYRLPPPSPA